MAYPAKTDRAEILKAGMRLLTEQGLAGLSLRAVAGALGVAPNALYRYFADRAALEAALASEVARRLHVVLKRAAAGKEPEAAVRAVCRAYLKFAREQRHGYEAMMTVCNPAEEDAAAHVALWAFVLELVTKLAGEARAAEAAVALWALLHGAAGLEAANIFHPENPHGKPVSGIAFGMDAWFVGARVGKA